MTFSEEIVWQVWSKGYPSSNDQMLWRKDECGAWIFRGDYGKRDAEYGWEIDHITQASDGGTDDISNLRPLHWENVARNEDGSLVCRITSSGSYNVRRV
ncbi:MAG: HNH endonuclease [Candidatus Nitrosotenuis sp.]|nr:MAG: HNH endonuclease [Candidatus Nitrosotenuis sp.]